ncbi:MAG TPA: alpha/beta hydrolase [Terriglobales bacterium]|nr:alpha/beta hydrolase [Terriglobales bacterium]
MLQGSSCASEREGFAALTQEWRPRFGLLYIPKPGATADAACGQGYLARNTIDQRLIDVLRVIQRLRTETWWNHELYVIGTSEGGLMAGLVGAFVPETKRIAILSYGGARTMGEWWPEAVYAHALKESGSTVAAEAEREEVIEAFQRARLSPDSAETFGGATNTLAWWASIIDVRLLPTLLDVEVPILLVHGTEDPYAPVEGARGVERAFAAAGKTNLTYREYAGLNHGFENAAGESSLERVTQDALLWTLGPPNGL